VRKLLPFLLVLLSLAAQASIPQWLKGSLVLHTREVLTGEVSIEARHDVVLLRQHGHVDVYPAHKISAVYYYDTTVNINRKFVSLASTSSYRPVFRLYEVVLAGEVNLLRHERLAAPNFNHHEIQGFQYLIRFQDDVIALRKFRNRIYPKLLRAQPASIAQFVKANHLNPSEPAAAIRIIQYYNTLSADHVTVAMY
jgi:hypothetical protein